MIDIRPSALVLVLAVSGCTVHRFPATVPPAKAASDGALRYRLSTEYTLLDPQGQETDTHVVTGDFTATPDEIQWTRVTVGHAHGQPGAAAEHRPFAEGVHYSRRDASQVLTPSFFRGYPVTANDEKNLIWDELMFDSFIRHNLSRLRLNEPFAVPSGDVPLAGAGTFTNRHIELTWTGIGRRQDQDCLVVHYEALLNRFTITAPPVVVSGRSDYMGDIWVAARTHNIEYGTLTEEVAGTVANVPGTSGPQPMHVLRRATLEHLR